MQGYEVITSDGEKLGHVVGRDGSLLLIERGTIRKSRFAVPQEVAHTDQEENEVRLTVSRQVVEQGPKADDGVDEQEVADYYGIVSSQEMGLEGAEEERARIREDLRPEGTDPGADGGVKGSALFHDTERSKE